MKSTWNYFNCNQLQKKYLSLRDLVLYCGLRSTAKYLVQVDVLPLKVHFLWSHGLFWRNIRKSSWNYRSQCGIIPLCQVVQNMATVLVAVFIWEYSRFIRNITSDPFNNLYGHIVGLHADSRKISLNIHQHLQTGECSYSCDVCSKTFSQKSNLKKHLHLHAGERPYSCDMCNKTFSDKSNLKVHRHVHTGERPYNCDM
jgi:stress-induced morphogen